MMMHNKYSSKMIVNFKLGILLFMMSILLTGCLAGYGSTRHSREINRIFESYQVLADHKYYYTGPEANPDAIMGIHRDYTLDSSLWSEIDLNSQQLKSWVRSMREKHHNFPDYPDGYNILDPEGKKIGIYYTPWEPGPVKMLDDNRVSVYIPDDRDKEGSGSARFPRFN